MTHFFGSHENRLDAKGRVSVPAGFRAAVKGETETIALILRPSHIPFCVEAWPRATYAQWQTKLDALDPFDPERDWLETMLFSDAFPVETDAQGRIVIPDDLVKHAGISGTVSFFGRGQYFQLWEPARGEVYKTESRGRGRGFTPGKVVS